MKKKLRVLLVAVMTMTLLSGCAVGGNSDTDNNQPTNPEGNVNVAEVDLEGVYWLCEDGDVMGFYLDGNGKYAELSGDVYKEGTYDCLQGVIENTVATYNFRTFDENGVCKYVACEVRSDGKVYIEEKGYAPVDEVAFNEYVPEPEPEPEPEPTPGGDVSSYPFIGKYFVDEESMHKLHFDEENIVQYDYKISLSKYEIKTSGEGIYTIINEWGSGYVYDSSDNTLMSFSEDKRSEGFYKAVSKEEYDAFGSN